jgi:hypothetical protein
MNRLSRSRWGAAAEATRSRWHKITVQFVRSVRPVMTNGGVPRLCLDNVLSGKYNCAMTASQIARILGRKGGRARASRLPAAERARIAAQGGRARAESLRASRRILENLRYADATRELSSPVPIRRERTCSHPLPGAAGGRRHTPDA